MPAAEAVDLPLVRGAHDPQQEVVPLGRVGGQVVPQEVRPLELPPRICMQRTPSTS
ncbi:hypothetical protein Prum_075420 [Phytohabitans rumicis]|uniref:Uncharacterized protein n=1 Tax=Phytohabitans rumicis TaxID=1076125 RepID=A0A6V8LE26_9ACTN|nr:hypothetical protein Prum_075420 [Phytohabitans rumicis]